MKEFFKNKGMRNEFPSPDCPYPLLGGMRRTCFLKNFITRPNILVGDYTYYDDETDVRNFEKNVLYHFDFLGDKLIIGKFCQIAGGATFLMNGMWHIKHAISTYPFVLFSKTCAEQYPEKPDYSFKGDTVIGNDVWLGYHTTVMPGVHIGDGAVIGTNSTVNKDIEPYTIVAGSPAKTIRKRFSDQDIELLLKIKWWDWSIKKITKHIHLLVSNDVKGLATIAGI